MGLVVVAVGIGTALFSNRGQHLELTGQILKVRVLQLSPEASLVVTDFRVTNPSDVPFVVRGVQMQLDPSSGPMLDGASIAKSDVDNVFKYEKLIGPKYTDVLTIRDRIGPHQTVDRMVGARFEVPESTIDGRKALRLRIDDLDGASAEIK